MGEGGAVATMTTSSRVHPSHSGLGSRLLLRGRREQHVRQAVRPQFGTLPYGYDHKYVYSRSGTT